MKIDNQIWFPYTQMKLAKEPCSVVSGSGATLTLADGRILIDAISSWWVITHGHNHPSIMQAIRDQTHLLDQVIFAGFTHEPAERVCKNLLALAPPGLNRVFFSDNGSTAVEAGLKMALHSWKLRGYPQKTTFVCFSHGYHGDTVGAMSVGGGGLFVAPYSSLLFPVLRADQGSHSSDPPERFTNDIEDILEKEHERIAAIVLEPLVQGAGGMIVWPETAVRKVAELSKTYRCYLIFDEVMTGFGRTGAIFASTKLGIAPDILCLAKGLTGGTLPLAATLTNDEVFLPFYGDDPGSIFYHGHSFTANPLACAAAAANLDLVVNEDLSGSWRRIERTHRLRIESLASHPGVIDARICGTIAALELRGDTNGYHSTNGRVIAEHALSRGVLLRPLGNVIYLLPPYCIDDQQLHRCWNAIEEGLDLIKG